MPLLARVSATASVFSLTNINNYCCCKSIVHGAKINSYKGQFFTVLVNNQRSCLTRFLNTGKASSRNVAHSPAVESKPSSYIAYDELLQQRRSEASRSIVVQVQTEKLCYDVYAYCSQFGTIKTCFHYTTLVYEQSQKKNNHLVLIEYEDQKDVNALLSASTHANREHIMPAYTKMLWFRGDLKSSANRAKLTNLRPMRIEKNACKVLSNAEVKRILLTQVNSISEQMMALYEATKLTDAGTRLRFMTAHQIEQCFKSLFPNLAVLPFGSSVNSFGKQGSDLDLSMSLDHDVVEKTDSKLVYQTKYFSLQEKLHVRRMMETVAECIKIFLPGVTNVNKILQARVPIIKFDHLLCGLECDLSATNMTAYYMSELLYIYGEIDWRVRPLVFTVRKWAETAGITYKNAGPWVTNFTLTLMVIFFLQQKKILPSLNDLKSRASKDDVRIADAHVDCTFLRDITILPKTGNKDSLEDLLLGFFSYYSSFDFASKAISLRLGKAIIKPENHSIYVCNPLETNYNVSKNVNTDQLNRMQTAARNATWQLETSKTDDSKFKGLFDLFAFEKS